MINYFNQGKEWFAKQSELKEKEKILRERAKEHEEVHEEKESLEKQMRLDAIRKKGKLSPDDQALLEARHERLSRLEQERKEKLVGAWKKAEGVFNKIDYFLGVKKSRRKKRGRY